MVNVLYFSEISYNSCCALCVITLSLIKKFYFAIKSVTYINKGYLTITQTYFMSSNQQPRRRFLQFGVMGVMTAVFSGLTKVRTAKTFSGVDKGMLVREAEGTHILTGRRKVPMNIKISKTNNGVNEISFCIEDMTPGRKMRVHKHLNNDELIFINKGQGSLTLDENVYDVKAGDVVFVPRGVWHGLDNHGTEDLRMIFQYTPAGFEQYFIENGTQVGMPAKERTEEEYAATEKKYGMVYKDNPNK
jgi:oxalate decarboxylase/phosphoglucose isomerase-like protein (cupin superfamily)